MNKMKLKALTTAMGLVSTLTATSVTATVQNYDWNGVFRFLDTTGNALVNTSLSGIGANQYDTPISGTMSIDSLTGEGTVTMSQFDWGEQPASLPFEVTSFALDSIGDGMGGPGTLLMGNMLFNWNGTNGIPSSMVLDAAGFLAGELTAGGANSATPASDGTFVGDFVPGTVTGPGGYPGYLGLGPVPIATTAWNTTNAAGCMPGADADYSNNTGGGCMGVSTSGALPLITDTALNTADYTANTGGTIGGSPMQDGPFKNHNFNFDFVTMTVAPPEIPVPAAVWLFGSGLLGLIGVARRKKQEV